MALLGGKATLISVDLEPCNAAARPSPPVCFLFSALARTVAGSNYPGRLQYTYREINNVI